MLKKVLVIVITLCALGSLGGVFLAGLNIYTRATVPQEKVVTTSDQANTANGNTAH